MHLQQFEYVKNLLVEVAEYINNHEDLGNDVDDEDEEDETPAQTTDKQQNKSLVWVICIL